MKFTYPSQRPKIPSLSHYGSQSRAISFNANDPEKIRKVDANPRRGELLWNNNRKPNWNSARAIKKNTRARNREKKKEKQRKQRARNYFTFVVPFFPKKCNDNKCHFNKCVDLNSINCCAFFFHGFYFINCTFFNAQKISCPRLRDKCELIIN